MSKYQNLSKEELLKLVEKQDAELASKKYGLVWDAEREPEQVVLDCENNLPVLKRVKGKEIRTNDEDDNILIEGDNYHALTVLNYTHKEKIDVIYIDPPYNTGSRDWKYNNNYILEEDGYRHSKWLNMMEKRLNIAKNLLTEKGIFVVAIDHNELFSLGLLCDKIFGENNRLGIIAVVHKSEGRNQEKFFGTSHEYMFFYAKNKKYCNFQSAVLDDNILATFNQEDDKGIFRLNNYIRTGGGDQNLKINKPHFFYPIYVSKDCKKITLEKTDDYIKVLPITNTRVNRTWKTKKETFLERLLSGEILASRDNNGNIQIYEKYRENQVIKTHWIDPRYHAIHHGTKNLENILGAKIFDFPKSLYLVFDTLKLTSNKEAVILDFFAGSGTTGHAVLELNKEDGGNRKFILCTNNENKICEEVTYPRIGKVINGYKNQKNEEVEGLGGNLQYFKTALIKKAKNRDQVRVDLTQKCTEMLCVKENIFNLEKEADDFKIFSANKKDKFLCVYYNFLEDSFDAFLKELKKLKGKKVIYMFSMDGKVDKGLFAEIDDFEIEEIPQKIIDIYKQLAKMNISVKADLIFSDFEKAKGRIFTDKEKDDGARILRIVIEKVIQKIAQNNGVSILKNNSKDEKLTILNDKLKSENFFSKIDWEENKTYIAIGNHAAHGEYSEYDLKNVENFYKYVQKLIDCHNIQ
jgi:adenine-specific DNA-methyltransferase